MILRQGETQLETHQPEKQHAFRDGRHVEEHLATMHLVSDNFSSANVPIWIVSLDLSKAFNQVHWPALCRALSEQDLFFVFAPFFCKVSVWDCCTGQIPGNEMTVLLVSLQATREGWPNPSHAP